MKKMTPILFTTCLVMASGAAAQGHDLHIGDAVYAVNLPYCTTLADAEKVADAARKTGDASVAFQQNDNCKNGRGNVVLVRQVDKFPDSTTSDGYRYIVEVQIGADAVYGILEQPVQPAMPGISI